MIKRAFGFTKLFILLASSVVITCDSFQEDLIQKDKQVVFNRYGQKVFYTLPNSSVVIDLKSIIQKAYSNVILNVTIKPEHGNLNKLGDFVWKYEPHPDFLEGHDQIIYSATIANGKLIGSDTVYIMMGQDVADFPCNVYAVEDFASIKPGANVSINFLDNDRICGIDSKKLFKAIYSTPQHGTVTINDEVILYTANTGYYGWDQFVYKINVEGLTTNGDSLLTSFGLISILIAEDTCDFAVNKDNYTYHVNPLSSQIVEFDILGNDVICSADSLRYMAMIIHQPKYGKALFGEGGIINYERKSPFVKSYIDSLGYRLCYKGNCQEQVVLLSFIYDPPESCSHLNNDYAIFYVNPTDPVKSYNFLTTLNDNLCTIDLNFLTELTIIKQPAYGSVYNSSYGLFVYQPNSNFSHNVTDELVYQLCYNGICKTATLTYDFRVINEPCEFVLNDDIYLTVSNAPITKLSNDYSPSAFSGNDVLCSNNFKDYQFSIVTNTKYGKLTNPGPFGGIGYIKDTPFTETFIDSLVYQLCLNGRCQTATVKFYYILDTVCKVVANDDYLDLTDPLVKPTVAGEYIGGFATNCFMNDENCGRFSYHIKSFPAHGGVGIDSNGDIVYLPNPSDVRNDSFQYEMCWGGLSDGSERQCSIGTVYIKRE